MVIGLNELIKAALAEDIGPADVTTDATVPHDLMGEAWIGTKQEMVLAGISVAERVFKIVDPTIVFERFAMDGEQVPANRRIAAVRGSVRALLIAERVALNLLQRMSGIATLTRQYVEAVAGTGAKIVDTRKTTPGLRALEKYAVTAGGADNHRFGLFDGVLIKDNHIAAAGGIRAAIDGVRISAHHLMKIEVEASNLSEVEEALQAGADVIMLDNMPVEAMMQAVAMAKGMALTEASGNVTLANVREVAATGVDLISVGALTHSAPAADISMKLRVGTPV